MSYRSYYLYQKYQSINGSTQAPVYPMEYSYDGEGTMPTVVKSENDAACGYMPPVPPVETLYRWVVVQGEYICEGYTKYEKLRRQVSYDGGFSWEDLDEYTKGDFIEADSTDCGYIPPSEPIYRWVTTGGYICSGTTKCQEEKEQVSYDSGQTWSDTGNYRAGTVIEYNSEDCGYVPPVEPIYRTVSGSPYCDGYDKKENVYNQVSYDSGSTWQNVSSSITVIEYNSEDCGYVPPTPSGDTSIPLTLEIVSGGTIGLSWGEYSLDNGATWNSAEGTLNLNVGDKVLLRGDRSQNPDIYRVITQNSTAYYKVYNNFNSMITPVGFENITTLQYSYSNAFAKTNVVDASGLLLPCTTLTGYCYQHMFDGCTSLVSPPALPATTLTDGCYDSMFTECTSLTTAPVLPATTLAPFCYYHMFYGCTSLTTAPELPATTLAGRCYDSMFYGCTSLTVAPELPATTLAESCYIEMFSGCTSLRTAQQILPATTLTNSCYYRMFRDCTALTTAPELPATTLAQSCYRQMFNGCSSLTTAPELPATTLANYCYYSMFEGCTRLNYIKCLATNISATYCTRYFTNHVASSGTFVKAASMTGWATGVNGIPNNWTVQNA